MFATIPQRIPYGNIVDTKMIWKIPALLISVETLWKLTEEVELRTSNWYGWLLVYLWNIYFPSLSNR